MVLEGLSDLLDAVVEFAHVLARAFLEVLVAAEPVILNRHDQLLFRTASPVEEVVSNQSVLDVCVVEELFISEHYCLP